MATNPTVLVKKADGTFARLTLDEIKKMKTQNHPVSGSPVSPPPTLPEPAVPPAPIVPAGATTPAQEAPGRSLKNRTKELMSALAVGGVVTNKNSVAQPPVARSANDFASPLEDLPKSGAGPVISDSRQTEIAFIEAKLSFPIAKEFQNRFRTVLQLYLKDIRSSEATSEVLSRRTLDGGLGFLPPQVSEAMRLLGEAGNQAIIVKGVESVTPYHEPNLPTTTTPFNAFIHSPLKEKPVAPKIVMAAKPESVPAFKLNSAAANRPTMDDVVAPVVEMGPVDEIRTITLIDFRRLAPNPVEAASRLKQKFINLKEESILLYLEAAEAWRQSPLYEVYTEAALESLARNTKLTALTLDKNRIRLDEIQALVEMEQQLSL